MSECNRSQSSYVMLAGMGVVSVALLVFFRWRALAMSGLSSFLLIN